jgi:hypothetical protein
MAKTLYLIESRAARDYVCQACEATIAKGSTYYRHKPHPYAYTQRGERASQWCVSCIAKTPYLRDQVGRLWIRPPSLVRASTRTGDVQLELVHTHAIGIGRLLSERLVDSPHLVHQLTAPQFQEFICDRLYAMGLEPKQVGNTYAKDGGIDVVFWPRNGVFPFLGAAQLKHHQDPSRKEGSPSVRDFAGSIAGHPFAAALLVTNTSFTPDARWFARERANLIRLRDFEDIRRWLHGDFTDPLEWREIPSSIDLCPGVTVKIR